MPVIELITNVHAPCERLFDLSLSVDLHTLTTQKTRETAIAGVTTGLLKEGESVVLTTITISLHPVTGP